MYRTAKIDLHRSLGIVGEMLQITLESLPWMEVALFGLLILGIMLS
ncbi:hypothetical protein [Fuscibacter oryzae]|uniref:Uncharacterized protein n=1 Tax=Fuscibacter oryzae TaxID=2803939 RepID=A0A8J7MTI3_9RHOB|nr:hypothetical protein [Fuscibacter oryzae]MBL4928019.1 hypothetical protein [Fuscibacter oryzae]